MRPRRPAATPRGGTPHAATRHVQGDTCSIDTFVCIYEVQRNSIDRTWHVVYVEHCSSKQETRRYIVSRSTDPLVAGRTTRSSAETQTRSHGRRSRRTTRSSHAARTQAQGRALGRGDALPQHRPRIFWQRMGGRWCAPGLQHGGRFSPERASHLPAAAVYMVDAMLVLAGRGGRRSVRGHRA